MRQQTAARGERLQNQPAVLLRERLHGQDRISCTRAGRESPSDASPKSTIHGCGRTEVRRVRLSRDPTGVGRRFLAFRDEAVISDGMPDSVAKTR